MSGDWTSSTAAGLVWSGLREGGMAQESLTSSAVGVSTRMFVSVCAARGHERWPRIKKIGWYVHAQMFCTARVGHLELLNRMQIGNCVFKNVPYSRLQGYGLIRCVGQSSLASLHFLYCIIYLFHCYLFIT